MRRDSVDNDVSGRGGSGRKANTRGIPRSRNGSRHRRSGTGVGPFSIEAGVTSLWVVWIGVMMMILGSCSVAATATLLARPIHFRVHHTHMTGQRIVSAECLLFGAEMTADLLLPCVVDGVLMAGQIVGS